MASLHLKYLTCETGRQTDCLVGLSRRRSYNTVPCLEECPCDMYLWVWEAGQGFPGEVVLEPRRLGAEHEAESWTVGPSVSPASSRHESCWVGHSGASLPRLALTSDPGESQRAGRQAAVTAQPRFYVEKPMFRLSLKLLGLLSKSVFWLNQLAKQRSVKTNVLFYSLTPTPLESCLIYCLPTRCHAQPPPAWATEPSSLRNLFRGAHFRQHWVCKLSFLNS